MRRPLLLLSLGLLVGMPGIAVAQQMDGPYLMDLEEAYALGAHMGVGTHVRYEHLFTNGEALDEARIEARVRWKF